MKHILTLFVIFCSIFCYAQYDQTTVYSTKKIIGNNFENNSPIEADEYAFPARIYNFQVDTVQKTLFVKLRNITSNGKSYRNNGYAYLIDQNNYNVIFQKSINYIKENFQKKKDYLISSKGDNVAIYNIENLNQSPVRVKNSICYVDFDNNIGIGYKSLGFFGKANIGFSNSVKYSDILEGFDLKSGKILWRTKFIPEKYFYDLFQLSDTSILISGGGLHSINVKTGRGWDYESITYDNKYKEIAGDVYGVNGLQSNIIKDSLYYYFAGRDKISCLEQDGQVRWSKLLPLEKTSESLIFTTDSVLYMINHGVVKFFSRNESCGKPYIAAFDIQTGEKLYLKELEVGEKRVILDFKIKEDTCFLLFKDRIDKFNLSDSTLFFTKEFNFEKENYMYCFINSRVYIQTDSIYQSLILMDTTKHYVINSSSEILILDDKLDEIKRTKKDEMYNYFAYINGFRILRKKDKTIIINEQNEKVAELSISHNAILVGHILYDHKDNIMSIIDLKNIVGEYNPNVDFVTEDKEKQSQMD